MTKTRRIASHLFLMTGIAGLLFLSSPGSGIAKTRKAKCDKGQSLQKKIDRAKPGDTILITGVCGENVFIGAGESDLVLLGGEDGAGISGPDTARASVIVEGRGIVLQNLTITGGRGGVAVNNNGAAKILGSFITRCGDGGNGITVDDGAIAEIGATGPRGDRVFFPNTISHCATGVSIDRASGAKIAATTISHYSRSGIEIINGAAATIGFVSDSELADNAILGDGTDSHTGIIVEGSSTAGIRGTTITNNQHDGVAITLGASAVLESNVIQGNGGNGIKVTQNSTVRLDGNVTGTENANGGFGLLCSGNASAHGSLDDLDGNQGASQSETGCVLDL